MSPESTRGVPGRSGLGADLIAQRGFMVVRRGYDQDEVRAFLDQVAGEVRALHARIEEASAAADAAPAPAVPTAEPAAAAQERGPLDEDEVVALVGEETAAVLRAARAAAVELRRRAEAEAERIVGDAHQSTGDMRREAEGLLVDARARAEQAGEEVRTAARAEAEALVAKARADADAVREQAEQERRLTVDGAQAMREKILGDLSRRRRVATVQIEQLRAGRERLLESYGVVRRTLEEVHEELQRADAEARSAADDAGRRAEQDADEGEAAAAGAGAASDGGATGPGAGSSAPTADAAPSEGESDAAIPGGEVAPLTDEASAPEPTTATGAGVDGPAVASPGGTEGAAGSATQPGGRPPAAVPDEASGPSASLAGAVVVGEPFEGVRILRGQSGSTTPVARADAGRGGSAKLRGDGGRAGPPVLRAVSGGLMASGGAQAIRILTDADVDEDAEVHPEVVPDTAAAADRPAPGAADEVFARLRSHRAASVAAARDTLAGDGPTPSPASGATPGPASASTPAPAPGAASAPGEGGTAGQAPPEGGEERSDEDEAVLQQRDRLTGDIEAGLVKRVKRVLQDEQNEMLDRLRHTGTSHDPATVLPALDAHLTSVVAAATPLLHAAAVAGASFVGSTAALAPDSAGPVATELAETVVGPLRRRLSDAVRESGGEQAALVEAIGGAYRECKTQRVEPAVVDSVISAFAVGTLGAAGPGVVLRWVVEDSGGPCADCDDNSLAGAQAKGEPWPTGQLHPPAHSGCRCMLVPTT